MRIIKTFWIEIVLWAFVLICILYVSFLTHKYEGFKIGGGGKVKIGQNLNNLMSGSNENNGDDAQTSQSVSGVCLPKPSQLKHGYDELNKILSEMNIKDKSMVNKTEDNQQKIYNKVQKAISKTQQKIYSQAKQSSQDKYNPRNNRRR